MNALGGAAAPIVVLGAGGVLILLLDLFWEGRQALLRAVTLAVLALGGIAAVAAPGFGSGFGGAILGDRLSRVSDLLAVVAAAAAVVLPPPAGWGKRWSAYLALLLWSAAGMAVAGGAGNLIMLFLGVEVLSLALYALVAFSVEDGRAAEAGFKYFVLGGLGSALLLYGSALVYAASGTLSLTAATAASGPLATMGLVLIVAGLGFKLALVPFQLWTPDVYEGASTPITAFMAVGTKAAAFAGLARVATSGFLTSGGWAGTVLAIGVLSMFAGYLLAIAQPGLKRLLAFSGVANAGTLVLVLLAPAAWREAAFIYLAAYAAATLGAFAVVSAVEDPGLGSGGADGLDHLRGLGRRYPWLAAALVVSLLSLASVPPTAGFVGKLLVLQALAGAGHAFVAVLVIAATVLALYPYFKLAVACLQPADGDGPRLRASSGWPVVAAVAAVATLAIGILPGVVLHG
ncbi:MAG TPA: NADH-quinone oxidoreductase subunit N [Bacillota bacterium]|nr:NADH-quinone oxidoreductase subunit N [Bacillota bacterium]